MLIISFGSGLSMEDESPANYAKFKELRDYADFPRYRVGGYSLLSSRWISDDVDVINPETGKRGGMIFGSSPCLCSDWGYDYFRKIKQFFEKTGMTVLKTTVPIRGMFVLQPSRSPRRAERFPMETT